MKMTFQQQLDEELLFSERKRVIILIVIFSAAIVLRLVNQFFLQPDEEMLRIDSLSAIWVFPLAIICFETFSLLYINARIRSKRKRIPLRLQYINAAFEICLPSLIILYIAKEFTFYNVLQSPAIFIYFIFIILSTLRLNFTLSVFCGLMAALSYASFSFFLYGHFNTNDAARAIILLFSGVSAGLVAKQIKNGINNSFRQAEKRHKVENLFGQQISMEIAGKMLENDGKIESSRMTVAVMFIDIRNFTRFAAGRRPEEIVQYQNAFFSIVVNSVAKYHGIVNQFLGDGCMVTFGAPVIMINPGSVAVEAAREILSEVETAMKNYSLIDTRIGIGIHIGEAVTGNIGTEFRQQYSITGNVVIVASRIEQLNKTYDSQILVSEDIVRDIKNTSISAEFMDTVVLKGMNDFFRIYKVA